MPQFAANPSMMVTEAPFLDRLVAVANAGFNGVEYLFPYDFPAEVLAEQRRGRKLENALFNLPLGNWAAGERGIACIPGREHEFRAGVATAIGYATCLNTARLHAMTARMNQGNTILTILRLSRSSRRWRVVKSKSWQPCPPGASRTGKYSVAKKIH
jgi:hydroxypyruvate isomerase